MTKAQIALKYLNGVIVSPSNKNYEDAALSVTAQMMSLGYIPSQKLIDAMKTMEIEDLTDLYVGVIPALRKFTGADAEYVPMYPNFPKQVMEASNTKLLLNAIGHYWSFGQWKPDDTKLPRECAFEHTRFKEIGIISEQEFNEIFPKLLGSFDSISEGDKETIKWFLDNVEDLVYPDEIPFKENMCYLAGLFMEKSVDITPLMKTATDVLRVATHMSGGDISLAQNTKFKSFSRPTRRSLVSVLENVIREEDIERHRNRWVRLFHQLHVGEFSYAPKVNAIARKVRENKPIHTFNGKVEKAMETKDYRGAVALLTNRPGEFARRLDEILRKSNLGSGSVIDSFLEVAPKVPTKVLLQILGNLQIRNEVISKKIIFPKGKIQKAIKIDTDIPPLGRNTLYRLKNGLKDELIDRFSKLEPLGDVWLDPLLKHCPIPSQMRSVSESKFTVGRGTRLPIGPNLSQNTLRLFIHWIGNDIDLSASLHDENFKSVGAIAYYNLRDQQYQIFHSGDIVQAPGPEGATEFIDITMDTALRAGIRYVSMDVRVFSGPNFVEHEQCYAGWMTREFPQSNEIFDAKTVQGKVDVISDNRACTPVVFDLLEREAVWTDLSTSDIRTFFGNNVRSNRASIENVLESIVTSANKVSLYELFELHAQARGNIVETQEEAEKVYSLYEGTTPFNIMEINSEYIG